MGRPRWTSATENYRGPTVTITVRVREDLIKFMDSRLDQPDLRTRSAAIQDAVALWCLMEQRDGV